MVEFPELAKLMATYGINRKKLAEIIEKAPAAITGKMAGRIEWKRPDMLKITTYFKNCDESVTMEKIFSHGGN